MNDHKNIIKIAAHKRVFTYFICGLLIISSTFFTDNNFIEILILLIASTFISVGAVNYAALRKHQKDEEIVKDKISRTKVLLEYIISKLKHFDRHLQLLNLQSNSTDSENHLPKIREILKEAQHLLQLINDSESLD